MEGDHEGRTDCWGGSECHDGDNQGEDADAFTEAGARKRVSHLGGTAGEGPSEDAAKNPNDWPVHNFSFLV